MKNFLGEYFYRKREQKGWSQREIVVKSHGLVTLGAYQAIENGSTKNPGLGTVLLIAKTLGVRPEDALLAYQGTDPDTVAIKPREGLVDEILAHYDQLKILVEKMQAQ